MERNARDIIRVSFESQKRIGVRGLDVVELYAVMPSCGKKPFIRGDAETVNLRVGMLDCSRANAGKSLPKSGNTTVSEPYSMQNV